MQKVAKRQANSKPLLNPKSCPTPGPKTTYTPIQGPFSGKRLPLCGSFYGSQFSETPSDRH